MPTLGSYLGQAVEDPPTRATLIFSTTNLNRFYFPYRGLISSLLIHGLLFLGILYLPVKHYLVIQSAYTERSPEKDEAPDSIDPKDVIYLPAVGGGDEGLALMQAFLDGAGGGSAAAASAGTKGFSYPGPQQILSNPPEPTNFIQTLMQPDLKKPPIVSPPISLPNFVRIADSGPVPKAAAPDPMPMPEPAKLLQQQPEENRTSVEVKAADTVRSAARFITPAQPLMPKMVLPVSPVEKDPVPETGDLDVQPGAAPPQQSDLPDSLPKLPDRQVADQAPLTFDEPIEMPSAELSPTRTKGTDSQSILALAPMPAPSMQPFEVPTGEARGRFAISPQPNFDPNETEPGFSAENPATIPATGNPTSVAGAPEVSGNGSGVAAGRGTGSSSGVGNGSGPGTGSGTGKGTGSGIRIGISSGTGSGSGKGSGSGAGTGKGPGYGAGTGPGRGAFSGITIVGGVTESGAASTPASPPAPAPKPLQQAYGVSIIATEASGGGLPYYGVFADAQIYTVFLDMRQTVTDSAPSWPLEFSVLDETDPEEPAVTSKGKQLGLVLPFPSSKEPPVLPENLVRRHLHKMVIVYGIVNVQGKMEQLTVKETPDALLNQPILDSLGKWIFRPAQLGGKPVAVKILMGIPLWLPF